MVTVHFGPGRDVGDGVAAFVYHSFYGKASVLFALVAGIGVGLLSRREPTTVVRVRMLYRATWLIPLGYALQALDHPVAVILHPYGVFFLGVVPFVGARGRTLLTGAMLGLLAGSAAVLSALVLQPGWMVRTGGDPVGVVGELVLGGYYPAVTWIPVLLVGMWLTTLDLAAGRVRWALVTGGVATLAITRWTGVTMADVLDADVTRRAWGFGWSVTGHSEMPLAVLGAVGFAVAVVGLALLLADAVPRLLHPLAALGRLALTVYVGHLVVYDVFPGLFPATTVAQGITHVAWFGVATAAGATLWLAVLPRGPLEAVVRAPWALIAPRVRAGAVGQGASRTTRSPS